MVDDTAMISSELLNIKPTNTETPLLINKKASNLEDIRKNFKATPSSVLDQVRCFLPKLASANADLQEKIDKDPTLSVDIEQLDNESAPHIEMNFALIEHDCDNDTSDSDTDSSDKDIVYGEVNETNIKLPNTQPTSKQPLIQAVKPVEPTHSTQTTLTDSDGHDQTLNT